MPVESWTTKIYLLNGALIGMSKIQDFRNPKHTFLEFEELIFLGENCSMIFFSFLMNLKRNLEAIALSLTSGG